MNQLFEILRLTDEAVVKRVADPDEPHCHDYEELIIGNEGLLEHFIDFRVETIFSPFVSFVTKGKFHRLIVKSENGKFDIWLIKFKSEFMPESIFQLYSYYHDNAQMAFKKDSNFERITRICEMLDMEMKQPVPDYSVTRQLLSTLFTFIESERSKLIPKENALKKSKSITIKNFLNILEENFRRPEGVEFYAGKLFMSARNLNLICNNILHQSVSDMIEMRKLIEAKNLLISTEKSISEIGFELGYNEKSYFSSVFKKKTGQTPTEFREEIKMLIS
jgi:AraC family transcriptional regulator, transcriptional activator of pobA